MAGDLNNLTPEEKAGLQEHFFKTIVSPQIKAFGLCGKCKHFYSYQAMYEDPLEPDDYGVCTFVEGRPHVSSDNACIHRNAEEKHG